MKTKTILLIDDHFVVRAGISIIIKSKLPEVEIDFAEQYLQALEAMYKKEYDLIILDINIPEGRQKKMIKEIKEILPDSKILIFTAYEENIAIEYILEGADGYINKLSRESEILQAIESIFEYGSYYSRSIVDKMIKLNASNKDGNINPFTKLSDREHEIADLLLKGFGNLEISNTLNIKLSTVSSYKKRIYKKLDVSNTIEFHNLYLKYNSFNTSS